MKILDVNRSDENQAVLELFLFRASVYEQNTNVSLHKKKNVTNMLPIKFSFDRSLRQEDNCERNMPSV